MLETNQHIYIYKDLLWLDVNPQLLTVFNILYILTHKWKHIIITLNLYTKIISFVWYVHSFQCLHNSNPSRLFISVPHLFPYPIHILRTFMSSLLSSSFVPNSNFLSQFHSDPKAWCTLGVFMYVFPTYHNCFHW